MDVLNFNNLSKFKNVVHGISTKKFGTMKNEDGSVNIKNLSAFLNSLGLENVPVLMKQVHGGNIEGVKDALKSPIENTDGLVTDQKSISLVVFTADCLPILFYDSKNKVIGIAHAGRKGLQVRIIKNIIEKFKGMYKSDPLDIIVGVGPGIEKTCYEVDGEFMDLRKIANDQLLTEGILEQNIENIDLCTKCNSDLFYSYRGRDKTERFAGIISLI